MRSRLLFPAALVLIALGLFLAACGDDNSGGSSNLSGSIKVDGSSTVGPLTEAAAELFREDNPDVRITVGISGTGGGFEKFCAGETDISDASRPIEPDEEEACKKEGVEYGEAQVANDGIAVVVNPENDWADLPHDRRAEEDLGAEAPTSTTGTRSRAASRTRRWSCSAPAPTRAPSTTSPSRSTVRRARAARTTAPPRTTTSRSRASPAARATSATSASPTHQQNEDKVKTVQVDAGDGCVEPTNETVQDASYKPLSRPLLIYPSKKALQNEATAEFVKFYVDNYEDDRQAGAVRADDRGAGSEGPGRGHPAGGLVGGSIQS